jgi:rare lipoprotein A (peptidoglycan hydrolase)
VDERQAVLDEIVADIEALEEQARLAAASAARPSEALLRLLAPSGPAPDIPKGFAGTGVSFEGVASWYGPGFEGNNTASGDVFDPDLYTAASRDLPLGTWLFVTYGGRGVVVLINDRGPYVGDRVLDLSRAAAEAIGISGLGWVRAELLIQT